MQQDTTSSRRAPRGSINVLGLIAKISVLLCIASVAIAVGLERPRLQAPTYRAPSTASAPADNAAATPAPTARPYKGT